MTNTDTQHFAEKAMSLLDDIAIKQFPVVVPLFIGDPNSKHRALLMGTAFLCRYEEKNFLVTARHVVTAIPEGIAVIGNFNGVAANLNGLIYLQSEADDLAVFYVSDRWLEIEGISPIKTLSVLKNGSLLQRTDEFILMGYPGTKNKLSTVEDSNTRNCLAITFTGRIQKVQATSHLRDPIAFHFDKKTAYDSTSHKINPPKFNGMSGGPVVEVLSSTSLTTGQVFTVSLVGIFTGWDKDTKEILCSQTDALVVLLEKFLANLVPKIDAIP
jgi:hypothetical protein